MRLDEYIKANFKVTRSRAQLLIEEDRVKVNRVINNKSAYKVKDDDKIDVEDYKYVSRAGYKLEYAYNFLKDKYNLQIENKTVLDIGSSTGGFTDFLLQNNIKEVVCVDVGTAQFYKSLLDKYKSKIKLFENTDIRNLSSKYNNYFDIVVCDVSFISLIHIITKIAECMRVGGYGVILFKPQFEVGKENINKGIVKDQSLAQEFLKSRIKDFEQHGLRVIETFESGLVGGDGNLEYVIYIRK